MDTNGKLILQGEFSRKIHSSIHHALNIQLTSDYKASENEDGFDELIHIIDVNATSVKVLGSLLINDSIIVYANAVIADNTYFTISEFDTLNKTYNVILKTLNIKVSNVNAISSTFTFNHKKERIIFWCDGVADDSNPPFTLNIDNNSLINPSTKELMKDVSYLKFFNELSKTTYTHSIGDSGRLKGGVYYVTTRTYFSEDDVTPWSILEGPIYIGDNAFKTYSKSINFNVNNIDNEALYIEYAVLTKSEGVTITKIKDKVPVSKRLTESGVVSLPLTLVINDNEGTDVDIRELFVRGSHFDKIDVISGMSNQLYVGNVVEEESFINYQKYANDIVVGWKLVKDLEVDEHELTFQDGEVYAFDISWILNSGALTPPYHIPGRKALSELEAEHSNNPLHDAYYCNPYQSIVVLSKETISSNLFKDVTNVLDVTAVRVRYIASNDNPILNVVYDTYLDFSFFNSKGVVTITDVTNFDYQLGEGVHTITFKPYIADHEFPFRIEIDGRINGQPEWVNITNRFKSVSGVTFKTRPPFTSTFRNTDEFVDGVQIDTMRGIMSYHENKSEIYPYNSIIEYSKGKVRHHRFPLIREIYKTAMDAGQIVTKKYHKVKVVPTFNNIYIPDDIKHLVKGYVISFIKKDIEDRSIFVSSLNVMRMGGDPIDSSVPAELANEFIYNSRQGVTFVVTNNTGDNEQKTHFSLINEDLIKSEISDIVTHVLPLGAIQHQYKIDNIKYDNSISKRLIDKAYNNLGFRTSSLMQTGVGSYNVYVANAEFFSKLYSVHSGVNNNAYLCDSHKYIPNNTDIVESINNLACDAFNYIKVAIPNLNYTHANNVGADVCRAFVNRANDSSVNLDFKNYDGKRYSPDVLEGKRPFMVPIDAKETNVFYIPLIYAYSKKDNVSSGFNNPSSERVIAGYKFLPDDIAQNVTAVDFKLKGDVHKGTYVRIQTIHPINGSVAKEKFFQALDIYNKNNQSCLSYSATILPYSSIVNPVKYYNKGDTNVIVSSEKDINKVIARVAAKNPLTNSISHYDKEYHDVNTYNAPIPDSKYENKITKLFNVIAIGDKANDVRSNIVNLKTFRTSNRYYMPIEQGAIVNIVARNNAMFIQQENNLSFAFVKDVLDSTQGAVYTGSGDIFDRPPIPLLNNVGGRIYCCHKFHCVYTAMGLCVIDTSTKAIYLINGENVTAISHIESEAFFRENLHHDYNNPLKGRGYHIASDNTKNTLIISCIDDLKPFVISFNAIVKGWRSFHSYTNGFPISTNNDIYSIASGYLYKHNANNKGLFYRNSEGVRVRNRSVIDIVCSDKLDVLKVFEAVVFGTKSFSPTGNGVQLYDKSVDAIMLYNENQCTGEVDVSKYHGDLQWFDINKRNNGNVWKFNNYRDLVSNNKLPFITDFDKEVILDNIDQNKDWFNNNLIISNAVVVRFVMNNLDDTTVQIDNVSIYARKSNV